MWIQGTISLGYSKNTSAEPTCMHVWRRVRECRGWLGKPARRLWVLGAAMAQNSLQEVEACYTVDEAAYPPLQGTLRRTPVNPIP